MKVVPAPARPAVLSPLSTLRAGQIERLVATPNQTFAILTSNPAGLPIGAFDSRNLAGVGTLAVPKPDASLSKLLGEQIDNFQRACRADKLMNGKTPFTTASLVLIGEGKAIQKLFDPDATKIQKISAGTGFVKTALDYFQPPMLPAFSTSITVLDTVASGAVLWQDLRKPDRNLAKCAV